MRKYLLLSAAGFAVVAASFAPLQIADAQSRFGSQSEVMTVDSRGVLTMAPLLERVTPAVVSINTVGKKVIYVMHAVWQWRIYPQS